MPHYRRLPSPAGFPLEQLWVSVSLGKPQKLGANEAGEIRRRGLSHWLRPLYNGGMASRWQRAPCGTLSLAPWGSPPAADLTFVGPGEEVIG